MIDGKKGARQQARAALLVPSPQYFGERVRVRGVALPQQGASPKPLTPALSPGYRGEGVGGTSSQRRQESDQVRQLLARELGLQPLGHDRYLAWLDLLDVRLRQAQVVRGAEVQGLGGVADDRADVDVAVLRDDRVGLVLAGEAGAGEDDRLEQIGGRADGADLPQVRSDGAALPGDRVAGGAGGLAAEEDGPAANRLAAGEGGSQL